MERISIVSLILMTCVHFGEPCIQTELTNFDEEKRNEYASKQASDGATIKDFGFGSIEFSAKKTYDISLVPTSCNILYPTIATLHVLKSGKSFDIRVERVQMPFGESLIAQEAAALDTLKRKYRKMTKAGIVDGFEYSQKAIVYKTSKENHKEKENDGDARLERRALIVTHEARTYRSERKQITDFNEYYDVVNTKLEILAKVHICQLFHNNISPDAFIYTDRNELLLSHFEISSHASQAKTNYIERRNIDGKIIDVPRGDPNYLTLNALKCEKRSHKDDLRSLMYMELERLTKNKLPWTPTITENMPDIVKVVEELKKERAILTDAALIKKLKEENPSGVEEKIWRMFENFASNIEDSRIGSYNMLLKAKNKKRMVKAGLSH